MTFRQGSGGEFFRILTQILYCLFKIMTQLKKKQASLSMVTTIHSFGDNRPQINVDAEGDHPIKSRNYFCGKKWFVCQFNKIFNFIKYIFESFAVLFNKKNDIEELSLSLKRNDKSIFSKIKGLPGDWFLTSTNQFQQQDANGRNACTTISLGILDYMLKLDQEIEFDPNNYTEIVVEFSDQNKKLLEIQQAKDIDSTVINPTVNGVIDNLSLNLKSCKSICFNRQLIQDLDKDRIREFGFCESRKAALEQLFVDGKESFAATLCNGMETCAVFQRDPSNIYFFDSHKVAYPTKNFFHKTIDYAHLVKFSSKEEFITFILDHRFYLSEEVAKISELLEVNLIEQTIS